MKRHSHHSAPSETERAAISAARQVKVLTARVQAQQAMLELMCADGTPSEHITHAGEVLADLLARLRATRHVAHEMTRELARRIKV